MFCVSAKITKLLSLKIKKHSQIQLTAESAFPEHQVLDFRQETKIALCRLQARQLNY